MRIPYRASLHALCIALSLAGTSSLHAEDESLPTTPPAPATGDENENAILKRLMAKALQAREDGDLYEAIEAFNTILSITPHLHRVRLELAVTHYQALNYANAREEAERVLADPALSEANRDSILRFLDKVARMEDELTQKHHWKPKLALGLVHDDNVNVGPSSDVINVGDQVYRIKEEYQPRADTGLIIAGELGHRYRFDDTFTLGNQTVQPYWQSLAALYHRGYLNEGDFDFSVFSLSTGPALTARKNWRASLDMRVDHLLFGGEDYGRYYSANPAFTWLTRRGEVTVDLGVTHRDYLTPLSYGDSSLYRWTGLSVGHALLDRRLALQAGIRLFDETPDNPKYAHQGREYFAGLQYRLSPSTSVFAKWSRKDIEYEGLVGAPFNVRRDETQDKVSLGMQYRFRSGPLEKWHAQLQYTHTTRDSNVPLYDYERGQLYLALQRAF
ncbi:MAG: surface lipoprotein assembly modifier [Pseudomonadota bacterium]